MRAIPLSVHLVQDQQARGLLVKDRKKIQDERDAEIVRELNKLTDKSSALERAIKLSASTFADDFSVDEGITFKLAFADNHYTQNAFMKKLVDELELKLFFQSCKLYNRSSIL